jgi:hypothetical protein
VATVSQQGCPVIDCEEHLNAICKQSIVWVLVSSKAHQWFVGFPLIFRYRMVGTDWYRKRSSGGTNPGTDPRAFHEAPESGSQCSVLANRASLPPKRGHAARGPADSHQISRSRPGEVGSAIGFGGYWLRDRKAIFPKLPHPQNDAEEKKRH